MFLGDCEQTGPDLYAGWSPPQTQTNRQQIHQQGCLG